MIKKKKNKRFFYVVFLMLISILSTILIFNRLLMQYTGVLKSGILDGIDQRMYSTYLEINNFPAGVADDLLFLSKMSDWQNLINNPKETEKIGDDLLNFLSKNEFYYQAGFINKKGIGVIVAEFDGEKGKLIDISEEENKKNNEYFNLLKNLRKGDVYIFPLEIKLYPEKISFLRYATPIFNEESGELEGIILVKIYTDYFFENVRRSLREGEKTYLIDKNGYYLASPEMYKEFSDENFFKDYPNVSKDIIRCKSKREEIDKKIFTYKCIDPTLTNFEIYKGSKTLDGMGEDYRWLLVTVTDKSSFKNTYFESGSCCWLFLIQLVINGFVFWLFFLDENEKREK